MRRILTAIMITMCFVFIANAQYVPIPYGEFRDFLVTKYPSAFNASFDMDTSNVFIKNEDTLAYSGAAQDFDGLQYFTSLKELSIYQFSTIGHLPMYIPQLTDSITVLYLAGSHPNLFYYGVIPRKIKKLAITDMDLSNSPFIFFGLPNTLEYLDCRFNDLTSLPILPNSLNVLHCTGNNIHKLDISNTQLTEFYNCSNTLDSGLLLPNTLKKLILSAGLFNQFINSNPTYYYCTASSMMNMKKFPVLPPNLTYLWYDGYYDIEAPISFPNTIDTLAIAGDDIIYTKLIGKLPKLPDSLKYFFTGDGIYSGFANLYCLPKLPSTVKKLYFDTTKIHCLPNYVSCKPNYPVCNPLTSNPYSCQSVGAIKGFVFYDDNNNGKMDGTDRLVSNTKIAVSNNAYTYTNANGYYELPIDSLGTYTVANANNLYTAQPINYTHNITGYDTTVIDTFALRINGNFDSLNVKITPLTNAARPGFWYVYKIDYKNVGANTLNPRIYFKYNANLLTFYPSPGYVITDSSGYLIFDVYNLSTGQADYFPATFKVKTSAILGNIIQGIATIQDGGTFNTDTSYVVVRGSFDPNDKAATPSLTQAQVADGKHWIDYTIRFENTGTDTAFTVVVADTLSNLLQANTVELISVSHNCRVTQNGKIIYFEYLNINLPDSNTNKTGCNGYLNFRVKPITTLVDGNIIPNKAAIYFDYNKPVITNIANTIIGNPLPLQLLNFSAIAQKETDKILVYWNTANEVNTSHFIIEQSIDGIVFKAAAEVAAKGIGSNSYFYAINKNKVVYVRLKMVDKNGQFTYSNTIKISSNVDALNGFIVLENPAKHQLKLNVISATLNKTSANLMNSQGKIVKQFVLQQGSQNIDITGLAAGLYYLKTQEGSRKVIVNP